MYGMESRPRTCGFRDRFGQNSCQLLIVPVRENEKRENLVPVISVKPALDLA